MTNCPNCGATNRDTARFCSTCGQTLPANPPAPVPSRSGQAHTIAVAAPVAYTPQRSITPLSNEPQNYAAPALPAVIVPPKKKQHSWHTNPRIDGRVTICDPARETALPFDVGRALTTLAAFLLGLGVCMLTAMFAFIIFIVLLVLGGGSLCFLPILLPVQLLMSYSSFPA